MNRKVKLSISGLHSVAENEDADVATYHLAEYFKKNDSHYLLYEEKQEGFDKTSKNRIKFKENRVELTRQGLVQTHMIFEENKKHMTQYASPYGAILLGIDTKRVSVEEQENAIKVEVEYVLEADGEHLSKCKIELHVEEQ